MANRFWVGGSGNWSDNTNHWSASSGGAGGASLPTSTDNVAIDTNSGFGAGGTITMDTTFDTAACNNFVSTTGHGYLIHSTTDNLRVYGNLTLETGITTDGQFYFNFYSTSLGQTITTAGVIIDGGVQFLGIGGGWTLQDDLTVGGQGIGSTFLLEGGTFDANGHNVTSDDYQILTNTGPTRNTTLNMGSGTWIVSLDAATGQGWSVADQNGIVSTINAQTSTIKFTDASANKKAFYGGGKTYNNIWFTGAGTGLYVVDSSNTFNNFKDDNSSAHTIQFTAGKTTTVTTWTVSGSAGNLITITSGDGSGNALTTTHALAGSGTISSDYLSIQHSVATPANTWYAGTHSTNNQAVATAGSGWIFTAPPVSTNSNFLEFFT